MPLPQQDVHELVRFLAEAADDLVGCHRNAEAARALSFAFLYAADAGLYKPVNVSKARAKATLDKMKRTKVKLGLTEDQLAVIATSENPLDWQTAQEYAAEAGGRAWEGVKRGGRRAKEWWEQRGRGARLSDVPHVPAGPKSSPDQFTVLRSFAESDGTHRAGELATDKRPNGPWFKKIRKLLGRPTGPEYDQPGTPKGDEWYDLDEILNDYVLKWPDGVVATLYFTRDDPEVLQGRWNIGARTEDASEAKRRIRALFSANKKSGAKKGAKKTASRTRKGRKKNPKQSRGAALRNITRGT